MRVNDNKGKFHLGGGAKVLIGILVPLIVVIGLIIFWVVRARAEVNLYNQEYVKDDYLTIYFNAVLGDTSKTSSSDNYAVVIGFKYYKDENNLHISLPSIVNLNYNGSVYRLVVRQIGDGINPLNIDWDTTKVSKTIYVYKPISDYAFYGVNTTFVLNTSNGTLGKYSFANSKILGICSDTYSIGVYYSIDNVPDHCFENCANLTSVILKDSAITIGDYAFANAGGESGLKFKIYWTSGKFQGKCSKIGDYAFYGCNLTTALYNINTSKYAGNGLLGTSFINEAESIGDYAFANCTFGDFDNNITFSKNLTKVGAYAFANSYFKPKDYVYEASITFGRGLSSIGEGGFRGTNLYHVDLSLCPLEELPDYCFKNCSNLTKVQVNDSLHKIGSYAFFNCRSIAWDSIRLYNHENTSIGSGDDPLTFSEIGEYAFQFKGNTPKSKAATVSVTGSVSQQSEWVDYDNGIGKVVMSQTLDTISGTPNQDYLFILDCSTTMYNKDAKLPSDLGDDKNHTRIEAAKEDMLLLVQNVYNSNPNSRIGIILYSNEVQLYKELNQVEDIDNYVDEVRSYITNSNSDNQAKFDDEHIPRKNYPAYKESCTDTHNALRFATWYIANRSTETNNSVNVLFFTDGQVNCYEGYRYPASNALKSVADSVTCFCIGGEIKNNVNKVNTNYLELCPTYLTIGDTTKKMVFRTIVTDEKGNKTQEYTSDDLYNFLKGIIEYSRIVAVEDTFSSKLNTEYWELYDTDNWSEGLEWNTETNQVWVYIPEVIGYNTYQYTYYIRLKDDYWGTSKDYLVSDNLLSSYSAVIFTSNLRNKTDVQKSGSFDNTTPLYLRWKLFNITYNGNGATGGSMNNPQKVKELAPCNSGKSKQFTVYENGYIRDGYQFIGWSTDKDSIMGDVNYAPSKSVDYITDDLTLYAIWKLAKYKIYYVANPPTGNSYKGTMSPTEVTIGEGTYLDKNVYTVDGYTFIGWGTDGTGNTVVYEDKDWVEPRSTDLTVYGRWKPITYYIDFRKGLTNN